MRTAAGVSHCKSKRLSEDCIYNAFVNVFNTFKAYRTEIIENYMYEINRLNASVSDIEDKIKDIDVKVANLSAKNLVITKLYTNGSLSVADYNAKTFEITTKLAELRAERKKLLGEERDRQIVELIELNETIKISPYISEFNEELFNESIDRIIVGSDNLVTFCLVGGLVGILLGRGAAMLVKYQLKWPIEPSPGGMIAAVLVSAAVGIVFGFYPAWKASKLDPIEALRYE